MITIRPLTNSQIDINDLCCETKAIFSEEFPACYEDILNVLAPGCPAADAKNVTYSILDKDCRILSFLWDGNVHTYLLTLED